jgi:hypothetical protein
MSLPEKRVAVRASVADVLPKVVRRLKGSHIFKDKISSGLSGTFPAKSSSKPLPSLEL